MALTIEGRISRQDMKASRGSAIKNGYTYVSIYDGFEEGEQITNCLFIIYKDKL